MVVMNLYELAQETGKIYGGSGSGQLYYSLASQRFKCNEQIGHTTAAIFVIFSLWTSGLYRDAPLLNELPVRFIQANHRAQRIVRTLDAAVLSRLQGAALVAAHTDRFIRRFRCHGGDREDSCELGGLCLHLVLSTALSTQRPRRSSESVRWCKLKLK